MEWGGLCRRPSIIVARAGGSPLFLALLFVPLLVSVPWRSPPLFVHLELRLPLLLMQLSQDVYIIHIMVIVLGVSR